jgi:hypothetical protein
MKIAAGGGGEVSGHIRLPEPIGDEVDDAVFGLQRPGDAEEGSGLGQGGIAREDRGSEDEVHEFGRKITRKSSTGGGGKDHATDLTSSFSRSPISSSCTSRS